MNLPDVIGTFKNGLMWGCLWALAALVAGVVAAWLRREVASAMRRLLTVARIAAFVGVSAFCVIRGGAKFLMPPPSTGGTPVVPVVVTPEEIAQGWRLESVTTNDAVSYAMPTNGVEYMPWSLGGGYEMHFALDLGDFAFPFGTGVVHRLDVLSGGMVESLPRQRMEGRYPSAMSICAATEYASIVPGVGRFWWADAARPESAPYQAKLLTWENVYAGRDRMGQYNAQIELRGDGNFITRSNNVERVYRRVLPFDIDNDGLPNEIDSAPETPVIPSVWNQSEAWAAAAFPSNAAEIAAMGGYAAWAAARGAEPDRRLVSLGLAFDDGSSWPTLLDFDGVPVVADGAAELVFAIDRGARVPFTLTSGRLDSLTVTATEPPMRSGEGMTTTESSEFQDNYGYPHDRTVNNVKVHLDDPRSGWLCRTAGVSIDGYAFTHLYPGENAELVAHVSDCHSNAYLGCTWTGGTGLRFSNQHSLSTTVTYDPDMPDLWATNGIDLITQFVGYSLTNHLFFTVGFFEEPPLEFSISCQNVFFLNDADFLEGGGGATNRPERIRPVTLNLIGPLGTNGTARLSVQGEASPIAFHVVNGVTNRITSETVFSIAVTNDFAHTGIYTVYVSCPKLGNGSITATFTPADGGESLTDSVTFRCIEPLRKLVTTEKVDGRYVNPSRLVLGTNAILKVGANGNFSPSEVDWRLVSGSAQVLPNGWYATVTPTGVAGDVVVIEARFNDDEIQPRFILPVVQPRVIPLRAFVVPTPSGGIEDYAWETSEIRSMLDTANEIFMQVGISFELVGGITSAGTTNDWNIALGEFAQNAQGRKVWQYSKQIADLVRNYTACDCLKVYFLGGILPATSKIKACATPFGILIGRSMTSMTLPHEIGHALGLQDCYSFSAENRTVKAYVPYAGNPVDGEFFLNSTGDWGEENGRGFYEVSDTRIAVMQKLLMHGFAFGAVPRAEIPSRSVFSLKKHATSPTQTDFRKVGEYFIHKTNEEVYSR